MVKVPGQPSSRSTRTLPWDQVIPGHEDALENPGSQALIELLTNHRWHFSNEQIQYRNTVVLDLQPEEELILARMKSKTRYNIRLAARKGVQVRQGGLEDLPGLYRLYARDLDPGWLYDPLSDLLLRPVVVVL